MTTLLKLAFEKAQTLPAEMQDEIARMLLIYAGDDAPTVNLTPEEKSDLLEALAEVERGEIASEKEVEETLSKYRL